MPLTYAEQLRASASVLDDVARGGSPAEVSDPLHRVSEAVVRFAKASSGSNFGFHSCIYYRDFTPPPPGAHFSSEWGLQGMFQGTTGDWVEYDRDQIAEAIMVEAGSPDLSELKTRADAARHTFADQQGVIISVLTAFISFSDDTYMQKLKDKAEAMSAPSEATLSRAALSRFANVSMMSRDAVAVSQGIQLAPHEVINVQARAISLAFESCGDLATLARRGADHIERLSMRPESSSTRQVGSRVFIGHGRSLLWRELKDFIADRLELPYDEFNRVTPAGTTNVDRLSEMMDSAAVALLVLTADDEQSDGIHVARQNVVHEAGLFQGRLGFSRAIIMLEEGCEPFSNVDGLGQLRFPVGNISATFEDVRLVLEREGLIEPGGRP